MKDELHRWRAHRLALLSRLERSASPAARAELDVDIAAVEAHIHRLVTVFVNSNGEARRTRT
jgi:hypothetical protein